VLLLIDNTWDGEPALAGEIVRVELRARGGGIVVTVEAPFHDDPPPPAPPGATDRLWEHEVVEVFLLGRDDAYLEIEMGPHGHHLAIELRGVRNVVKSGLPLPYRARIDGSRWTGEAEIPAEFLPPGLDRVNAFAIHGVGAARRFLAAFPAPGPQPDFHRLDAFGELRLG
jgi:hypothetical protein